MAFPPHTRRLVSVAACVAACGSAPSSPESSATPAASHRNQAPQIASLTFEPAIARVGETLRVLVAAHDVDRDPIALAYSWRVDGEPAGTGTAKFPLGNVRKGQRVSLEVVASDGRLDSEAKRSSIVVANQAPVMERIRIAPGQRVTAGETITIDADATDADGDELDFKVAWSVNGRTRSDETGARFDTAGLRRGDVVSASIHAWDGDDASESLAAPDIEISNTPPRVTSRPIPMGADGFHVRVDASDPDGDEPLRFELENPPQGMTIGALTGDVQWKPSPQQTGDHRVRVWVDDDHGGRIAHEIVLRVGRDAPPASNTR